MFRHCLPAASCLPLLSLLLLARLVEAQRRLRYRDWQLVFRDGFDTYRDVAGLAARLPWQFHPDTYRILIGNSGEDECYDFRAIELHEGNVRLVARPLPEPLPYRFSVAGRDPLKLLHFSSGWLNLKPAVRPHPEWGDTACWLGNRGFEYGLFEIRCRVGARRAPGRAYLTSGRALLLLLASKCISPGRFADAELTTAPPAPPGPLPAVGPRGGWYARRRAPAAQ